MMMMMKMMIASENSVHWEQDDEQKLQDALKCL